MSGFEKAVLTATALFLILCAAVLLRQTSAPAVTGEGCTVYASDADGVQTRTVREKLDEALGTVSQDKDIPGRIDINTASAEELISLPGIGETLAARIIRYRTYNGAFSDASQLCDVTGIGEGIYAGLAALVFAGT